jgi:hypothetical protein
MTQTTHRVNQIRALPEAAERPDLATAIAMRTTCSVAEAQHILRVAPKEQSAAKGPSDQNLAPASNADDEDGDNVRQMVRSMGLKGFGRRE